MSSAPVQLRGTVSIINEGPCRVALLDENDEEWPIAPRGAGVDLTDMVGCSVALLCSRLSENDDDKRILVRSYKELDDESSWG